MYGRMFLYTACLENPIIQEGHRSPGSSGCHDYFCLCPGWIMYYWGDNVQWFTGPLNLHHFHFSKTIQWFSEEITYLKFLLITLSAWFGTFLSTCVCVCAWVRVCLPVQLQALTGVLQSLHWPSYSSLVLSCIRYSTPGIASVIV